MTSFVKCHACQHVISVEAKRCPSCGATRKKVMGSVGEWIIAFGLCGVMVMVAIPFIYGHGSTEPLGPADPAKRAADDAMRLCRYAVERKLKDPDSVKWDSDYTYRRTKVGFQTTVSLRAKNSFGAYDWGRFTCIVEVTGGRSEVTTIVELER